MKQAVLPRRRAILQVQLRACVRPVWVENLGLAGF